MKQWWTWLPIVTFFLAAGLTFAGQQLAIPRLTYGGFLLLGLTAVLSGIELIRTKQAFFLPSGSQSTRRRAEYYSGLPAQLWGVFFLLAGIGATIASLAALRNPQQAQAFVERLFDTPGGWGVLLAGLGVFLSLYGLIRLVAGSAATNRTLRDRITNLGYRGVGGLCLLIGLGLVALGWVLMIAPDQLLTWIKQILPQYP